MLQSAVHSGVDIIAPPSFPWEREEPNISYDVWQSVFRSTRPGRAPV